MLAELLFKLCVVGSQLRNTALKNQKEKKAGKVRALIWGNLIYAMNAAERVLNLDCSECSGKSVKLIKQMNMQDKFLDFTNLGTSLANLRII